jgi:murein DD-endopeptidase MepM/ murein hydrolase activator NlpD
LILHTVFIAISFFALPAQADAFTFASFTEKLKTAIIKEEEVEETPVSEDTAQTMPVLKPVVVEEGEQTKPLEVQTDGDTLSPTIGSLRLSNEEAFFPMNDTIAVYEVKKGDTISSIAKAYGVSRNTIIWANDIKGNTVSVGQTLVILPITGIKHTVRKGDTIASIAKKYKADADDIAKYNGLTKDTSLAIEDVILVPEGEITVTPTQTPQKKKPTQSRLVTTAIGFFVRPLVGGIKTQGIHGNNAVDIAARVGTPIVATAPGRVIVARASGYNGGYGNMIVIMHENNIQTLYAHLRDVYVSSGATVSQGQVIGAVGNTGRSTGPHLHIEVRGAVNPF